jgi:hypothetical protein
MAMAVAVAATMAATMAVVIGWHAATIRAGVSPSRVLL